MTARRTTNAHGEAIEAYPLHWPREKPRTPADDRRRANFGKRSKSEHGWTSRKQLSVAQAVSRLLGEFSAFTRRNQVWRVHPDAVVISTNIRTRNDGLPWGSAGEPDDPAVAVYFRLDEEPHCIACDCWDRVADNIAAIAATVNAQRGLERWGAVDLKAAFAGFRALPGGRADVAMTETDAIAFISQHTGLMGLAVQRDLKAAYRLAAKRLHPDSGGNAADFAQLQEAIRVLGGAA
jgi:hypothetical protein